MLTQTIREKAYGKLNLSLDVLGKRDDGYHEMLMLMQSVSLCDEVTISVAEGNGLIGASTNKAYIPNTDKNLGFKAAKVFMTELNIKNRDVTISIKKRVPVCAGMGGGSSDAAAVIRGLNRVMKTGLSFEDMRTLAGKVGSDAPFCVQGGTALASGRGTEFTVLEPIPSCAFAIVKPRFSISTPALFSKLDSVKLRARPDTEGMLEAIRDGDLYGMARRCFNVFEAALSPRERDTVEKAKGSLVNLGALGASMTGTGSAVYGIFRTESEAYAAEKELSRVFRECYVARPAPALTE